MNKQKKFISLFLIHTFIWFVYRTIEVFFNWYKAGDFSILNEKILQFLFPSLLTSIIIILLYLLSKNSAKNWYSKVLILFINFTASFIIYFYLSGILFTYIWYQPFHSNSIGHFVLAGYNYWLVFFTLNFSCFAFDFWYDLKIQRQQNTELLESVKKNQLEDKPTNQKLFLQGKSGHRLVEYPSIKFIQADTYLSIIVTSDNLKFSKNQSLKKWEDILPPENFVRIHKSFIVNIDFIESIKKNPNQTFDVYLKDYDNPIQMSRRIGKEFYDKFKA